MEIGYQADGFAGVAKQTGSAALAQANRELNEAIQDTPPDKRSQYRSVIRWEGDGYAWYWIKR